MPASLRESFRVCATCQEHAAHSCINLIEQALLSGAHDATPAVVPSEAGLQNETVQRNLRFVAAGLAIVLGLVLYLAFPVVRFAWKQQTLRAAVDFNEPLASRVSVQTHVPQVLRVAVSDPEAQYRTIGAAIAEAGPGDTILITDGGTYHEYLRLEASQRLKDVTIRALERATLSLADDPRHPLLTIGNLHGLRIEGLRLETVAGQTGIVINGFSAEVMLENLELLGMAERHLPLLQIFGLAPGTTSRVTVNNCKFSGGATAIQVEQASGSEAGKIVITNNRFLGRSSFEALVLLKSFVPVHFADNRLQGCAGIAVGNPELEERTRRLRVSSNHFDQVTNWLNLTDASPRMDLLEVHTNVISGGKISGINENRRPAQWSFQANLWHDAPAWLDVETLGIAQAIAVTPFRSDVPSSEDFLLLRPEVSERFAMKN